MPNSEFEFCNSTSLVVTFRTIISTFTEKKLEVELRKNTVKLTHKRTNVRGLAMKSKTGRSRPKTARTVDACMELRMLFVVYDTFNVLSCSHCFQPTRPTTSFELR